ncbi:MAG: hypothetical protein D6819_08495 [Gammaproteobacteria bacterium]|nr:MAG: hypothetical protein D6819_08495 [Gammaproteobacteria bacterium]
MDIQDYRFGSIRIDGRTYTRDVLLHRGVRSPWWRKEGHVLHPEDLEEVLKERPRALVVGTGYYGRMKVPEETMERLKALGIETHVAPTSEAIRLFRELQKRYADIAAAFHLTC